MSVIGEAFIRVRPESGGFGPEAEKNVTGALGSVAKKIGVIIGGAFAAREVVHGIKDLLEAGTGLNRQLALTNAAVKSTGGIAHVTAAQIDEFAQKQAALTGISANTIIGQQRVLLAFTNVRNEVGRGNDVFNQAARAAENISVALGKGLQGASVLVGRALQDPIKGLAGLGRAGVQFTTKQKDLIKSLVDTGHTLEAQKLILAAVEQRFGGAAAAGATAGAKIKAAFESAKEQVGITLVPIANAVANAFVPVIPKITSIITQATKLIGPKITPVLAVLPRLFQLAFTRLTKIVVAIVVPIFKVLRQVFIDLEPTVHKLIATVQGVGGAFSGSFGGLGSLFKNLLGSLEPLIVAVLRFSLTGAIVGLQLFGTAVRVVSDLVVPLLPALQSLAAFVAGALGLAFVGATLALQGIGSAVSTLVAPIESAARRIGETLGPLLASSVDIGRRALRSFVINGVQFVTAEIDKVGPTFAKLRQFFRENEAVIKPAAVALTTFVTAIAAINQIESAVATAQTAFNLLGPAVSSAIAPLIEAGPVGIAIAAVVAIAAAFVFAYTKVKPFHDAVNAVAGLVRTVAVTAFNEAADALTRVGAAFSVGAAAVSRAASIVGTAVSGIASSIVTALTPLGRFINDNLISTLGAAVDFFSAVFVKLGQILRPVVTEIIALLRLVAGVIRDQVVFAFKLLEPVISGALRAAGLAITTFARVVVPIFLTAFDGIAAVVRFTFDTVRAIIVQVLSTIRGLFLIGAGLIRGDWSKIWKGLELIAEAPFKALSTIVRSGFTNVLGFLETLPGRFATIGSALFRGFVDQIRNAGRTIAATAAGAVSGLLDTVTHLPAQIARFLGSGATAFSQGARALTAGLLNSIGSAVANALPTIGGFFAGLPGQILGFLSSLPAKLAPVGVSIMRGIGRGLTKGVEVLAVFFIGLPLLLLKLTIGADVWLVQTGVHIIEGLVSGLVSAGPSIGAFFVGLPGQIIGFFGDATRFLVDVGKAVIGGLLNGGRIGMDLARLFYIQIPLQVIGFLGNTIRTLVPKGVDLIVGLLRGGQSAVPQIVTFIAGLPAKAVTALGDVTRLLVAKGLVLIASLRTGIATGFSEVGTFVAGLPGKLVTLLGDLSTLLLDVGKDIIAGLLEGIRKAMPAVKNFIRDHVVDPIKNFIKNPFSILSPSKWARDEVGGPIVAGILEGMKAHAAASASAASADVARSVQGALTAATSNLSVSVFGSIDTAQLAKSVAQSTSAFNPGAFGVKAGTSFSDGFASGLDRGLVRASDSLGKWRRDTLADELNTWLSLRDKLATVRLPGFTLPAPSTPHFTVTTSGLALPGGAGAQRQDAIAQQRAAQRSGVFAGAVVNFPVNAEPLHIAASIDWATRHDLPVDF